MWGSAEPGSGHSSHVLPGRQDANSCWLLVHVGVQILLSEASEGALKVSEGINKVGILLGPALDHTKDDFGI